MQGEILWDDLRWVELSESEELKYRLNEGDVVFSRTNSAELVGKTAVFESKQKAVFAQQVSAAKHLQMVLGADDEAINQLPAALLRQAFRGEL